MPTKLIEVALPLDIPQPGGSRLDGPGAVIGVPRIVAASGGRDVRGVGPGEMPAVGQPPATLPAARGATGRAGTLQGGEALGRGRPADTGHLGQ
jgi:hypothetical protein